MRQQRLAQRRRRRPPSCRPPARPTRRSGCPLVVGRARRPTASKFSSAKPSGSITLWQLAQTGFARCSAICSRIVLGFSPSPFSLSCGTSGGGGGTGVPRMFSRIHLPRTTGDVRSAYDVTASTLPWPSSPQRALVGQRHAAEAAAVDVRDAVVPRQPLVDERVVRRQQVERRCGPRAMMLSKNSSVSRWNAWRRLSSKSGNRSEFGCTLRTLRSCSHWPAKLSTSACDARIGQHPPHLPLEHGRILQLARARQRQQLVVRDAAPEEERQARRELDIADAIRRARRRRSADRARRGTGTSGWRESAASAASMPVSKLPSRRPSSVESSSPAADPARSTGCAVRAARERREDLLGAGRLAGRGLRTAREDPAAAGRVAGPVALNGPVIVKVWMCGRPAQSKLSIELRRNGCRRTGSATGGSSTNATVTSCGPAVTGTRTRSRASTASPVSVGFSNSAARSSRPPIVAR